MSHAHVKRSYVCPLIAVFIFAMSGALLVGTRRPAPAHASETSTTSGQLTAVNSKGDPVGLCPLKHTDVVADVSGYCARVTIKQDFHNPFREPIEAVYTFPLPSDAAVDDMTMTIGQRVVKGEIKRREEARNIYETARAAGQSAALLDQERPNIFTQSVANIGAGQRISITISYVQILKYADGQYEFVVPMVVGPRFVAGGGHQTLGKRGAAGPNAGVTEVPEGSTQAIVTDGSKISPPITPKGKRAGHDISLTVNLDAGIPLTDVRSQLHPVRIDRIGKTRAVVRLANRTEIPNRDFILHYRAAGSDTQEGILAYADSSKKSGYFTLILQPPAVPSRRQVSPKEMVFVIDQTGSQSGEPIKKAKQVMRHCIRNLNAGDTFQLIGFNTQIFPCFEGPVAATEANIEKALKFLAPIEGSGGTDILKSVDYALKLPDDPDRLRIVCYMTDGYVGNDLQILDYVKKNRGRARMFPFGIGNSVNRFLIEGIAREGKGAAEIVDLQASAEAMASTFYHRIADPLLLNIEVDWNGMPVEEVYPKAIPDLYSAGPILLKGRYSRAAQGDITISGTLRGQPWRRTIHMVLPAKKDDGAAIATVWAREKIEDLQSEDWIGAQTGTADPKITEKIVHCALEYRLMSQYTSFVAVEQRVVNVGGKQRTIDVPVEMPDGVAYEGIFGAEKDVMSRSMLGRKARSSRGLSANGTVAGRFMSKSAGPSPGFSQAAAGATRLRLSEQLSAGEAKKPTDQGLLFTLIDSPADAEAKLAKMTPDQQKQIREQLRQHLRTTKLHTGLAAQLGRPGGKVVEAQIWVRSMPKDGVQRLKLAGFSVLATLTPGRLMLGAVDPTKIDALLALKWVVFVEPPKFK